MEKKKEFVLVIKIILIIYWDASRDQRKLYRIRHEGDNLKDPMSPGSLSFFITWGSSRDIEKNIKSFKKRYNV
jgi:hypothetical protein